MNIFVPEKANLWTMAVSNRMRFKLLGIQLLITVAVNVFVLPGKWSVLDLFIRMYYPWLVVYAFRKTRICPLVIMRRTRLLNWPRAFRLMYGPLAGRMMVLYFSGVILFGARSLYSIVRLLILLLQ